MNSSNKNNNNNNKISNRNKTRTKNKSNNNSDAVGHDSRWTSCPADGTKNRNSTSRNHHKHLHCSRNIGDLLRMEFLSSRGS